MPKVTLLAGYRAGWGPRRLTTAPTPNYRYICDTCEAPPHDGHAHGNHAHNGHAHGNHAHDGHAHDNDSHAHDSLNTVNILRLQSQLSGPEVPAAAVRASPPAGLAPGGPERPLCLSRPAVSGRGRDTGLHMPRAITATVGDHGDCKLFCPTRREQLFREARCQLFTSFSKVRVTGTGTGTVVLRQWTWAPRRLLGDSRRGACAAWRRGERDESRPGDRAGPCETSSCYSERHTIYNL